MRIRFAAVAALLAFAAFITTEFASADQYFFRARGTISATSPGGGSSNGPGDEVSLPPGGTPQNEPLIAQGTPPTDSYVGEDVAYAFTASGGTAPYTWTLSGSLPPGLSFNANGTLSGKVAATAAGQAYSFSVNVTDAVNQQHSIGPFSINVAPQLTVNRISGSLGCAIGTTCIHSFEVANAAGPVSWTLVNGLEGMVALPREGNDTIVDVAWTPPASEKYNIEQHNTQHSYTIQATDGTGSVGLRNVTISLTFTDAHSQSAEIISESYLGTDVTSKRICRGGKTFKSDQWVTANVGDSYETHFAIPVKMTSYGYGTYTVIPGYENLVLKVDVFDGENWNEVYNAHPPSGPKATFPLVVGTGIRAKVMAGAVQTSMFCARRD